MRSNQKFHAIAIAVICIVITAIYLVMGTPQAPVPQDPNDNTDHAIEIYSATWGEECNPYIQDAIERRAAKTPEKDANGVMIAQTPLKPVIANNVLTLVGDACNGQLTCDINPTPTTMGVDPLPACAKKLELSYRCYSFDRLWNLSINQGATTTIDCHERKTEAKTGAAAETAASPAGK